MINILELPGWILWEKACMRMSRLRNIAPDVGSVNEKNLPIDHSKMTPLRNHQL